MGQLYLTFYYIYFGPPLWSSGLNSSLQIQLSGFDSRRYQMFWELVGLERGPLSLVSKTEELIGRKSSCSDLENREYGSNNRSLWPRNTLYPQKLALTSPISGGCSIGVFTCGLRPRSYIGRFCTWNPLTQCLPRQSLADSVAMWL
jgi:hypothetical protein